MALCRCKTMTNSFQTCAVVSLRDIELEGQVSCARRWLVVIAPGLSEAVAKAIVKKWQELGHDAVQIVLDPDPEVCRLGLGDLAALQMLQETAKRLGGRIHQQQGLRVGIVVTDETTTVYSPTPRLIEAGGQPGERLNAIRLDTPILVASATGSDLPSIDLHPKLMEPVDVENTRQNLTANPPVKFDLARKVHVFNARFEFVEFELRGLSLSRKRVPIPSDLMGLARDPTTQKLLRSSFQLIDENSEVSGDRVTRFKQFIAKRYLIHLPGYGTVILRSNKGKFQIAVKALERYVDRFQERLKKILQNAIDRNRERLISALLPSVAKNPPVRWTRFVGEHPGDQTVEQMLRSELTAAFGNSDGVFEDMSVKAIFKGVTYELLSDPDFMRVASKAIPLLDDLHEEFEAAKAAKSRDEKAALS
jgi:hypothetical protein